MKSFLPYKVILWDFDGVIMDSMPIRSKGFENVLLNYPDDQINELLAYHQLNGGLSRYVKFRYFFEQIRGESITEDEVKNFATKFSEIMLSLLINEALLIKDSVEFIRLAHSKYEMHIVSGSDQEELRKICEELNLSQYFKTINGSPTPKKILVKNLIEEFNYEKEEIVLIGDSINDVEASLANGISFRGYNNINLEKDYDYISSFELKTSCE